MPHQAKRRLLPVFLFFFAVLVSGAPEGGLEPAILCGTSRAGPGRTGTWIVQ